MRYTTNGATPACFGPNPGQDYSSTSPPTFSEGRSFQVIACATAMFPSDVVTHDAAVQAGQPQVTVATTGTTRQITLQSPNEQGSGFFMRYALGSSCTRTADVTCNSTSPTLAYSAPFSLVDNRYPLFYDGSQYTACVKAIACGDNMSTSAMSTEALSLPGDAPLFSHRVATQFTLSGYSVASLDLAAQGLFKLGLGVHSQVSELQITINAVTDPSTPAPTQAPTAPAMAGVEASVNESNNATTSNASNNATATAGNVTGNATNGTRRAALRRSSEDQVHIALHVDVPDADTASSVHSQLSGAQSDPSGLLATLQAEGLSAGSGLVVHNVSSSIIVHPTGAPTGQPTGSPTTAAPTTDAPTTESPTTGTPSSSPTVATGTPTAAPGTPTAAPGTPTAAPTSAPSKKVSQAVSFTHISDPDTYNTDTAMKAAFEYAYGLGMGIVKNLNGTMTYLDDCEVTSAASSRRGVTVTFEAMVADHQQVVIPTEGINANDLSTHISSVVAADTSGALSSVTVPDSSQMTVAAPVITTVVGTASPTSATTATPAPTASVGASAPASGGNDEDFKEPKYMFYFGAAAGLFTLLMLATLGMWQMGYFPSVYDDEVKILVEELHGPVYKTDKLGDKLGSKTEQPMSYWTKHRANALAALKKIHPDKLAPHANAFVHIARHLPDEVGVRDGVAELCALLPTEALERYVLPVTSDTNWEMRVWALHALGHLQPARLAGYTKLLLSTLKDTDASVRLASIQAMAHVPAKHLADLPGELIPFLDDSSWPVQQEVALVLNLIPAASLDSFSMALVTLAQGPNQHTRAIANQVLNQLPAQSAQVRAEVASRRQSGASVSEIEMETKKGDRDCGMSPGVSFLPPSMPPTMGPAGINTAAHLPSIEGSSRSRLGSKSKRRPWRSYEDDGEDLSSPTLGGDPGDQLVSPTAYPEDLETGSPSKSPQTSPGVGALERQFDGCTTGDVLRGC